MNRNAFTGKPSRSDCYFELTTIADDTAIETLKINLQVKDVFGDNASGQFSFDIIDCDSVGASDSTAATANYTVSAYGTLNYIVAGKHFKLTTNNEGKAQFKGVAGDYVKIIGINQTEVKEIVSA